MEQGFELMPGPSLQPPDCGCPLLSSLRALLTSPGRLARSHVHAEARRGVRRGARGRVLGLRRGRRSERRLGVAGRWVRGGGRGVGGCGVAGGGWTPTPPPREANPLRTHGGGWPFRMALSAHACTQNAEASFEVLFTTGACAGTCAGAGMAATAGPKPTFQPGAMP